MPRLSRELISSEYKNYKGPDPFGLYMNTKYLLKDLKLAQELDNNVALLRLLKDHVPEEKR